MKRTASPQRRGFTLMEMLVTMTIGAILLLLSVQMLSSAGAGYERGNGGVAAEREGRAALTQMESDLAKAVWHTSTVLDKGEGSGWKQAKLGLFCLQPDDAQTDSGRVGDLCAVGYSVKDIQVGGSTVRCLMRTFRESSETFTSLKGGDTDGLFKAQDKDEPVAFGVVSFEISPLVRATSGKWEDWDKNSKTGPGAVRVKLVIARHELIAKLKNSNDWNGSPLIGKPSEPENGRNLEVFEVIQRFGNDE